MTYGQFHDHALRWASVLSSLGVERGDVVGSWLPGGNAFWTWFGARWLGAIHVPIDPGLPANLLAGAVRTCGARLLVIERSQLAQLDEIAAGTPSLKTVVVIDEAAVPPSQHRFDVLAGQPLIDGAEPVPRDEPDPSAVQIGLSTSGTTGPAKCAQRTWEMLSHCGHWSFPADTAGSPLGGALYNPWPLFHSTGLTTIAAAAERHLTLVLRRKFSTRAFWDDVREYGCSHVMLLVVAPLLLRQPRQPDDINNPLRQVTICPLIRNFGEFERRFGVQVGTVYGQAETGVIFANPAPSDSGAIGKPVPNVVAGIVGPDGTALSHGQAGELVVRGVNGHRIITTYINADSAASNETPAGSPEWMHTGDIFSMDSKGDFHFVDRLKDYIRHRGHSVSSVMVEDELSRHPDVEECACVGVPSEFSDNASVGDEDVKVVVVAHPGALPGVEDITDFLAERQPSYMVPSVVAFADPLPRTPTGKVKKAELRRAAADGARGAMKRSAGMSPLSSNHEAVRMN